MLTTRRALHFNCQGSRLIGVLDLPDQPSPRGVLIVTGGPQYRAGSHRQFVLLARHLADLGIAVMRFDYRGMGDSEGDMRGFEDVQDDLAAAVRQFFSEVPKLREIVLWGLCDGGTAAAFHAPRDRRISGLVMLNPWVRTDQGLAQATLRHYYVRRLLAPEFWRKLTSGGLGIGRAISSLMQTASAANKKNPGVSASIDDLPQRLRLSLSRFRGPTLIILSGADLGAREFLALAERDADWRMLLSGPLVQQNLIPLANHTFARKAWRDEVAAICAGWMAAW
jgi:exosortase A-associated hydrolase 1